MFIRKYYTSLALLFVLVLQFVPAASPGVNSASAASYCDAAGFVMDVTVADGTTLAPNTPFTKTWRLKNNGTCTWSTAYTLFFSSGTQMGAPSPVNFPNSVAPGATVDLSVQMIAPAAAGHYRGNWMLKNASGVQFGIGSTASSVFWVDINVSSPMIEAYDFTANYCAATWHYDGGPIPCPFKQSVQQYGYVLRMENATLENGTAAGVPGLLTVPQDKYNGVIMGVFPEMDLFPGDHFQALIGCEYLATSCYVQFELDYLTPNLDLVTIWKFREKYDGSFYRADIDLSRYAYKKGIKLVLIVSAYGPATGDRALWIAPRILRPYSPTSIATSTPTQVQATSTPSPTATLPPATICDKADFVLDVTVPDNTTFLPNQTFTKTWRMRNAGTCTWDSSYSLVFISGDQMGGAPSSPLSGTVAPGGSIDISAYLTAPAATGTYQGFWMLRNASGGFFGIGSNGTTPFWVKINVAGSTSGGYDFAANLCSATWTSGAGALACPGTDNSPSGFAFQLNNPQVENGTTDPRHAILASPQAIDYGWIQGMYPAYVVQSGDRFQTTIACQFNAAACDVFMRLDYQIGTGPINTLWAARERNDGASANVDVDLASLAGQNVRFILTLLSNGSSSGDRALWIAPQIYHPSSPVSTPATPTPSPTSPPTVAPTQTPVPTFTSTPDPLGDWLIYLNSYYGFQLKYPPRLEDTSSQTNSYRRIDLSFVQGTNLDEKYLEATVTENAAQCKSSKAVNISETVTINGISFLKESGVEGAVGNRWDVVAYSAFHPGTTTCVTMDFVLHSTNPGNFATPPPTFDLAAESVVFGQIMSTFAWTTAAGANLATLAQSVVTALNVLNFSGAKNMMDTSFLMAFWQSQGTSYTPDAAISLLQTNYIGASTHLVPDAAKDLTALLGGSNPYTIVGLDPAKSVALFVSGWGLNGTDQAILYVTQRPDGTPYWYGVLVATGGFANP